MLLIKQVVGGGEKKSPGTMCRGYKPALCGPEEETVVSPGGPCLEGFSKAVKGKSGKTHPLKTWFNYMLGSCLVKHLCGVASKTH